MLSVFGGNPIQGETVKITHRFASQAIASQNPQSVVQGTDGNFYGLASAGGSNGTGTVFKITPAGSLTTLHSFGATDANENNSDGTSPLDKLVQGTDGSFYGTAFQGGANNTGTIFKITPAGVFTLLASFGPVNPDGTNANGAYPRAGLIQGKDGSFYGTASGGGANGEGVVFKITSTGTTLTTLHNFSALDATDRNTDGTAPYSALVQGTDGSFYGAATGGGANNEGTLFKITSAGAFKALYSFSALDSNSDNKDGATPSAALVQGTDGNFYGLASAGGTSAQGTFFQLTLKGAFKVLHSFTGNEGSGLASALVQGSDGNFYGVAFLGGIEEGTAFKLTAKGALTLLHVFEGVDGANPSGALVQDASGNFYGVASSGGVYNDNGGTFFKLTAGGDFTKLTDFGLVSNRDGAHPDTPLVLGQDGNFYGMANSGGANGNGTIFMVTPAGVVTVLHTFSAEDDYFANSDGAFPNAALVQGTDGSFYGTASGGGTAGEGTFFKITPAGGFTTLYSFGTPKTLPHNVSGAYPFAPLVQGKDGNFYGTTTAGGTFDGGTVFKGTSAGVLTVLHVFNGVDSSTGVNADGSQPYAGLVQGKDGNFYGMARYGGANASGTIFKVTPSGNFTILDSFAALNDGFSNASGAYPVESLIQGTDGSFYGTAPYGGAQGGGAAFKVTSAGQLTTLHSFATYANGTTSDGVSPFAGLLQATDGNFYGTTSRGSINEEGTVFELTPAGTLTTLYSFGNGPGNGGANPNAGLVQDKSGNLFGTTLNGGNGAGTIYQVTLP